MIALIQRVSSAQVDVGGNTVGSISRGLCALVCAERGDTDRQAESLLGKLVRYRVFGDESGRMNRSLLDVRGGLLLVPQFTLAADTRSGTRPSFTPAAPPDLARELFARMVAMAQAGFAGELSSVQQGLFGADMQVSLTNDGPVTFWLQVANTGTPVAQAADCSNPLKPAHD
jgi:D-tyrosyl-tRNA(Tyr) deacylase